MIANPPWFSLQFIGEIWRFPKIGVPPNHPFFSRLFHEINYPAISSYWGTLIPGNLHINAIKGYVLTILLNINKSHMDKCL